MEGRPIGDSSKNEIDDNKENDKVTRPPQRHVDRDHSESDPTDPQRDRGDIPSTHEGEDEEEEINGNGNYTTAHPPLPPVNVTDVEVETVSIIRFDFVDLICTLSPVDQSDKVLYSITAKTTTVSGTSSSYHYRPTFITSSSSSYHYRSTFITSSSSSYHYRSTLITSSQISNS